MSPGMVQIPEINVNDKESATLWILRSSGLKFQVSFHCWKGMTHCPALTAFRCHVSFQLRE